MKKERTSNSKTPSSCHPDEGRISNTQNNINHINTNIMKTNRVIRFIKNSINNLKTSIMNKNDQRLENVEAKSTNLFNKVINYVMNKKIENVEELEASSTHTNKFGSIGTALMLVFMVIAFSAFTQINKKAIENVQCFEFSDAIDNPTESQASNPDNYLEGENTIACIGFAQTLCGICFNTEYFEVDQWGLPNFDAYPNLKKVVEDNRVPSSSSMSISVTVPGTTPSQIVTLHYRSL